MATTTLMVPTTMSFADFELLDFGADDVELLRGELIRLPPPQRNHMQVSKRLLILLDAALKSWKRNNPGALVGEVEVEMGYLLPTDPASWLRPDVSLTHPNQPGDRYYEGPPLVVFEVVSEYDTAARLNRKIAEYLSHGTAEVWVIYPDDRHAWVYRGTAPEAARETLAVHSELLPGIEIPLDQIL